MASSFERVEDIFSADVFSRSVMRQRLPKEVYKSLLRTIDRGEPLDPKVADVVAATMKDWAIENGATHFTHWFQPLTGLTAEKHDSLVVARRQGGVALQVLRQRPGQGRAGRLELSVRRPAGHVRSPRLHRVGPDQPGVPDPAARAARTLCIPTAFVLLDRRGPGQEDAAAALHGARCPSRRVRILKVFGTTTGVSRLHHVGPEQEYFLIDRDTVLSRGRTWSPCERTLFGARPPKGQQLEDHYFGAIPPRVLAFMDDVEQELYRARRPGQDAAQRSGAGPVRDRAALRAGQRRQRSPDADDGDHASGWRSGTGSRRCCTRSRSPASTARASTTTGRCPPTPASTCSTRRTTPTHNIQFLVFLWP